MSSAGRRGVTAGSTIMTDERHAVADRLYEQITHSLAALAPRPPGWSARPRTWRSRSGSTPAALASTGAGGAKCKLSPGLGDGGPSGPSTGAFWGRRAGKVRGPGPGTGHGSGYTGIAASVAFVPWA
jgi:hypothetical protein